MEGIDKLVHFDEYCKTCKHKDLKESESPCYECLENPTNVYSHQPIHWEKK